MILHFFLLNLILIAFDVLTVLFDEW